jgi:hypothetical protein
MACASWPYRGARQPRPSGRPLRATLSTEKKYDNTDSSHFEPGTGASGCDDAAVHPASAASRCRWGFLDHARSGIDAGAGRVQAARLTDVTPRKSLRGGDQDLAESTESGARSGAGWAAGPLFDRPVGMLDRPLHDLGGRLLGKARESHRRLQERYMELLAVLRPGQQAGKNHQLYHAAHSYRCDQCAVHATRTRRRLKAGVE